MANCSRCGTIVGEGAHLCASCIALADADNVPCQRCGMYLPSHELKMFNSRLYCSYCIMDLQDEEEQQKKKHEHPPHAHEQQTQQHAGAAGDSGTPPTSGASGFAQGETLEQLVGRGACSRCGRECERLCLLKGEKMCEKCAKEQGGATEASKSFFHAMHEAISRFLVLRKKG